jgi:hypothetical protein
VLGFIMTAEGDFCDHSCLVLFLRKRIAGLESDKERLQKWINATAKTFAEYTTEQPAAEQDDE